MRMRLCSVTLMLFALAAPAAAWEARLVLATGQPVVGATVVILGRTGEAVTDADGRFQWQPDPSPPFEMLVVLHDGTYMKPVTIERLAGGPIDVTVHPLVSEAVTVTGVGSVDRVLACSGHDDGDRPRRGRAPAYEPDAGGRERGGRQSGVGGPGGGAGRSRPRARPHPAS